MPSHLECRDESGGHKPDAEPTRHVNELRAGPALGLHLDGLQCHPADRAGPRPNLTDLGMHRTGVDRALRNGFGGSTVALEVCGRRSQEPFAAAARTEIVATAIEGRTMCRRVRIDVHPAHWILDRVGHARGALDRAGLFPGAFAHATAPVF